MRFEKSFTVDAPIERVWAFLTDPHQVAKALPGAEIVGQEDDKTWKARMKMKVGPVSPAYDGKVVFEKVDEANHAVELSVRGQAARGMGGAEMRMASSLAAADGGGTRVETTSDVSVSGILAQFGRGMIDTISDRMFDDFVRRVKAELEA